MQTIRTRRRAGAPPIKCKTCGSLTDKPRRENCERCYLHEYRGLVPLTDCACCGLDDPRMLVRRQMVDTDETRILCGNCATLLGRRPIALAVLRVERLAA